LQLFEGVGHPAIGRRSTGHTGSRAASLGVLALALLGAAGACDAGSSARHGIAQDPVIVDHLALSADARHATLTVQLTQPVHVRYLRLSSPERVVIDLPGARRHARLPQIPAGSLVRTLRTGMHDGHTLRLVLQLRDSSALRWSWQAQPGGAQLRIELTSASPDARALPATSAGATLRARSPGRMAPGSGVSAVPDPLQAVRAAHAPGAARDVIVAVDAGHGGVDPGATGPDGTHEKNVTLAIARALAARIDQAPGMRAVLTRDGDYFVPLRDRMERARAAHADLFVSIHADSVGDRAIAGSSVYILSERGASSEAARRLADQENAADLKGGISLAAQAPALRSVLMDLSQNASMGQSGEAAQDVLGALDRVGAVRKREVQQAAFVVLKSPDVPSMLIETAYISNPLDEQRLRDPVQQQRLAQAIFSGIADYFRQYPPQGSLFARAPGDALPVTAKGAS
jgi:N-acetylmuramoyl-L-alanine amidase